jgi:hypothetical protein
VQSELEVAMEAIEVDGLPPELVGTLRTMVQVMKAQLRKRDGRPGREVRPLPAWPGDVIRPLTREDLYSDPGRA